ncbi:MAG: hypothetical protein EAX86_05820 [Candidatus Heimdallarchaeota archaeon]|nr:hypothetical protein [Candidatus Heimdallarchaeota archaeon]
MTISTIETTEQGEKIKKLQFEPQVLVQLTNEELFSMNQEVVEQIQLKGIQIRFETLYPKVQALKRLAEEQGIQNINSLNDVIPLLFQHTVYKSYPLALIEKHQFSKLTQWMNKFTTHDISKVNVTECKSIDDWLEQIEKQTDLKIVHSTGTSGKLSFLPRSASEMQNFKNALYLFIHALTGVNPHEKTIPVFFPGFRDGRQLAQRVLSTFGPELAGSPNEFHTAIPDFMSADFMALAGRMQVAKAKGELGKMQMIKALAWKRGEILKLKRNRPKMMQAFFDNMIERYKGRQVFLMGPLSTLISAALEGEKQGYSQVFAPNSAIVTGGGLKGMDVPNDWYERICRFYGVKTIRDGYGMTETTGYCPSCEYERYHIYPFHVPYVLDPDTGKTLPRKGIQTGRFAFYDLLSESYWGGIITGDEVTIHWNDECECGRKGPWIEKRIQRFSEKQGDDKISCAGAQEAYDNFLDFLLEVEE